MARYLIFPLVLILILVGALAYAGNEKWVEIALLASESATNPQEAINISLQAAILGLAAFITSIIVLWSLCVWLWRLPKRVKYGFGRKREVNGLEALEDALLAGEAGDGDKARKYARRAHELLSRSALSALVSAKAAEAAGEIVEASEHYTALLDDPKTEGAGLRGLARLAANKGDHQTTIEMAKAAYAPSKGPKWAFEKLFKSLIATNNWDEAIETLFRAEKRKHMDKTEVRRRKAVLYAAQAAQYETDGDTESAISTALKAVDTSSGFAPAVALAARLLTGNGQSKKAASLIEKAWGHAPHPALALSYSDIFSEEPPRTRAKKIKTLIKANPDHRESLILGAEEALHLGDPLGCLQAISSLLSEEEPSARLCALASASEAKLGNEIDARSWHFRAASAPVEAAWSDLDPDGPAFNYTQTDWQRLVMSYGETGELIHPRHEMFRRRKAVVPTEMPVLPEPEKQIEPGTPLYDNDTPPSPDDPGSNIKDEDTSDLSQRLENLLDTPPKS